MIENIKQMYGELSQDAQRQVIGVIQAEFGVQLRTARDLWIWDGAMPEKHQPRIVEIMQNACIAHGEKLKAMAQ